VKARPLVNEPANSNRDLLESVGEAGEWYDSLQLEESVRKENSIRTTRHCQ
jgi:hypothetical protein